MAGEILFDLTDKIATITLNRPDKLNAWTPSMEELLREFIDLAARTAEAHVIVLTGAGKAFCAGADLSGPRSKREPPPADAPTGDFEQRYSYLLGVPKPIIAAINGAAAGVGLAIALYADLRFICEGSKINTAFVRRGLIAEHGTSWLLPRLVGTMNAMDLLLTGKAIDAQRACEIGLGYLLPAERFQEAVRERAEELATWSSPRAMAVIKRQIYEDLSRPLGQAVVNADREQFKCFGSDDLQEGISSFLEKRPPRFRGIGQ
ncbi:enoyl-CoA hydratase-related protein [Sphingobium sp. V4]|uniref:enoyl-CoA hydratase-related protein n=1 Tax=Sphingobium sp. V4 TaxID=3038927 RepID=UPI002557DE31|nr:enoyl-CoA hydratase-related protein [Sphingobium sp. V4]WIW89452.1 enoyl-CoA hydratase-related protein [Sphingobium sp. V4]